jgi:hypothetical protein
MIGGKTRRPRYVDSLRAAAILYGDWGYEQSVRSRARFRARRLQFVLADRSNVSSAAFLLIADYIVTAAISALSAFQYLGIPHPELFAGAAILVIGGLNFFGPKHTGVLAIAVSIPTIIVVCILGFFSLVYWGSIAQP